MKCIECGVSTRFGDLKYGVCSNCRNKEKESLGIADEGAAKTHSKQYHTSSTNGNHSNAIQTLKGFAQLVLVIGIFISIAILIGSLVNETYFLIVYAIAIFIATFIQWAFIKVFAEMAEDIKEIRNLRASGE